jgi:hypothetical protein
MLGALDRVFEHSMLSSLGAQSRLHPLTGKSTELQMNP